LDLQIPVEFHQHSFDINESLEKIKKMPENGEWSAKQQRLRSKLENENRGYHVSSLVDFVASYKTDLASGLTEEIVGQRLQRDGENVLKVKKKNPFVANIVHFFSGFSLIMWIGAAMCFVSYKPLGDPPDPMTLGLGIVLLICIFVMAIFNIVQEQKSNRVMKSILRMLPTQTIVIRNGSPQQIAASQLVEGDVVELSVGKVPADIRVIKATQLRVDNSVLTGESEPITCTTVPTNENYMETKNVVFLGAIIIEGTGQGVVVSTGERSVMGFITKSASSETSTSYMQKEITRFMIFICIVAGSIGASLLFLWAVWLRTSYPTFLNISQMVTTCVGVIVGFLPDGLPVCITLTLTIIARRMFKNNILVKHLPTVENLGCVDVIASDKTGTLTQNKMSVARAFFGEHSFDIQNTSNEDQALLKDSSSFIELLRVATLCNQAYFDTTTNAEKKPSPIVYGNASDSALLSFAQGHWNTEQVREQYETIAEIPFNSRNKWSLSLHKTLSEGRMLLLMKGATEIMIQRSTTIFQGDQEVPLSEEMKEQLIKQQEHYGNQGERVLGFCRIWIDPQQFGVLDPDFNIDVVKDDLPMNDFCFVGMICLIDPPREEVPKVINACKGAGIRVMMVTGDHAATAVTIARWVNIVTNKRVIHLTGDNAEQLVEEDSIIPKETLVSLDMIDENSVEEKQNKKKIMLF
jgi:sodium/potassium-transporting ATPase subunit alpha